MAGRRALPSSSPSSSSSSSLPWDTGPERRPSAYAHYKKLVRDFDALDEDLEQSRLAQGALEAQLQHHQDAVAARTKAQHDQELAAWARERERRVEAICVHGSAVDQLRREQAALEEQELRLEAELDVLREKQQLANETEAKRVFDLVHVRTSRLEQELEKGRVDVEYLAHVISRAKQEKQQQQQQPGGEDGDNHAAIRAVVADVKQRRQDALREATAQLQQRLQSFELEKAALQRKAEEIQWKKQRALQVLSTNQQQVIAGFFTTPRAAIQDANPPLPALEFDAIVQGLRQPTGDVVGRLQELEHGKMSGRRQQRDALADAQRNLETGPARLDAIQRQMLERRQDALRLQIAPTTADGLQPTARAYDGAWGVETYRQEQFPIVYYVRSLVFAWMEDALEISRRQPATQLLEMDLKRHVATHAVLETLATRTRLAHVAVEIADDVEREVAREMAASVLEELRYSGDQVRDVILKNLQAALFSSPSPAKPANGTKPAKLSPADQQPASTTLRWSMFEKTWAELSYQRDANACVPTRRLPRLLMQPAEKPVGAAKAAAEKSAESPTKKRFGFFGGASRVPPGSEPPPPARTNASEPTGKRGQSESIEHSTILTTDTPFPADAVSSHREATEAERDLWARHVRVSESSFSNLPTCAFISSVQFSADGQLLAVGTLDGEVVVFTMGGHDDETATPTAMRASAPDKAASASSALGVARITRLCFSQCGRLLLSFNHQKVAVLWTLAPPPPPTAPAHSADFFQTDVPKAKPPPLSVVSSLAPLDLFQEPPVPLNVLEHDAPVAAARLKAAPTPTMSAFEFFPSVSLTGEPTSLLCGASNGDFLKVALIHTELRSTPVPTRELFRSAHRDSVIFVSAIASLAPSSPTRLVSVDERGGVALWSYARSNFSGFGWFVPRATYLLDLASTGEEMLQIQLTHDRKTLVLMVFLASSAAPSSGKTLALAGRLRFVQLDLTTNDLRVKPVRVELPMAGTIAPRFALLRVRPPTRPTLRPRSGTATRTAPSITLPGASSFLVLLMDNALHVLSLRTGELCRPAIPLHSTALRSTLDGRARPNRKEPTPLLFNAIAAGSYQQTGGGGGGAKDHVAIVAVAGEQHRHVRLVRFHIRNTHS